jgi:hypothetical protein
MSFSFTKIDYSGQRPGFTIVELVVASGIVIMLSLLVIANFKGSNQRAALDNEAERLGSILRQANINSLIGLTVGGVRPAGGFGLYLATCESDCSYSLFADTDSNSDHLYDQSTGDTLVQEFGMFDDNVYIDQLVLPLSEGQSQPNNLSIAFVPPQGLVFVNGSDTFSEAKITLGFANSSDQRTITLTSKSGQIDIQ